MQKLDKKDVEDYANPTGKVQTQIFFIKYNVSVAAATFGKKPWFCFWWSWGKA